MTRLITFRPGLTPGTIAEHPREGSAEVVEPFTFYQALFNHRINASAILTMLPAPPAMSPAALAQLEAELVRFYWDDLQAFLTPLRVQRLLRAMVERDSTGMWLEDVMATVDRIMDTTNMELASELHAQERVEWLLRGARGEVPLLHVAAGEFLADYTLLQRAIAEDMRLAEQNLEEGSRIPYLRRLEDEGGFVFEQIFQDLMSMDRVVGQLPASERRRIQTFQAKREAIDRSGLFDALGLTGPML